MKAVLVGLLLWPASPVLALDIVPRSEWGAKQPLFEVATHSPVRITIHHTATRQKPSRSIEQKLRSLQAFSQSTGKLADGRTKKAWADVPYHYYIDATGRVAEGREIKFMGDTNTNYDPTGHIAIVVEGNFEVETLNEGQRTALTDLVLDLSQKYDIPKSHVGHHKSYASTLCPGANLANELQTIIGGLE